MPNFNRLREAYAYISSQPTQEFDLSSFNTCALGKIAKAGLFGLKFLGVPGAYRIALEETPGTYVVGTCFLSAEKVFELKVKEATELFGTRKQVDPVYMKDKEVWMHRMHLYFARYNEPLFIDKPDYTSGDTLHIYIAAQP